MVVEIEEYKEVMAQSFEKEAEAVRGRKDTGKRKAVEDVLVVHIEQFDSAAHYLQIEDPLTQGRFAC
jgi:hypothetical protein